MVSKEKRSLLLLYQCILDTGAEVVRSYTEPKLTVNHAGSLATFLDSEKHFYYHQWNVQRKPCCACPPSGCSIRKVRYMDQKIFDKMYTYDRTIPVPVGHQNNTQNCICRYISKNIDMDHFDLIDLNFLLKSKKLVPPADEHFVNQINTIRCKIFHAASSESYQNLQLTNLWADFETALLHLAEPLYYRKMVKLQLSAKKETILTDAVVEKLLKDIESSIANQRELIKSDIQEFMKDSIYGNIQPALYELREQLILRDNNIQKCIEENTSSMHVGQETIKDLATDMQQMRRMLTEFINEVRIIMEVRANPITDTSSKGSHCVNYNIRIDALTLKEDHAKEVLSAQTIPKTEKLDLDQDKIEINSVETKCILLEARSSSRIFRSEKIFREAILSLIQKVLDAGEVDTSIESTVHVSFEIVTPLNEEEIKVVLNICGTDVKSKDEPNVKPSAFLDLHSDELKEAEMAASSSSYSSDLLGNPRRRHSEDNYNDNAKKTKYDDTVAGTSRDLLLNSELLFEENRPFIKTEEIDEDILKYQKLVSQLEMLISKVWNESSEENKECVLKWYERLSELKKDGYDSTFIIGVIGRTRHGKSSLINALLEPFEVLPVSDTQSCTAVAVQIEKNTKSDEFEAEIEFFTKEEWDEELSILKGDFEDGKEDRFKPDTVAGMAYSKIEAVYGKFEQLEDLPNEVEILSSLGQTKTETTESASELRQRIENYIRAFSEVGNQYWPIVKKLTVRIPGNNTIVDGCTLVDLPGYGDDTAARVKVAEDFLKNCSKILVVSEITEALSNKYVRLNGCFGEQILRDLMESNLVFICTMNDKRVKVDSFVSELRREKEEDAAEQLQQTIKKIDESLSSMIQEKDRQKLLLDRHRLGINARAALVKKKIIKNYQEVVEKWNRRDTGANIDISKNNEPAVFCVSSDEYLNIKHKDVCQTFSEEDETEIPALKNHINQLVMNRKLTTKQHKIKKLDYIVTDIAFYLKEGNFEYKDVDIKECVNKCVLRLMSDIEAIAGTIEQDITKELSDIISKLDKGREKSEIEAMNTCKKWSQYHRKTFFAVLRRKGIFDSKTSGFINFNKDMIEPFTSNMTSVLSDFFNARFWSFMDAQIKTVQSLLEKSAKILCDKIAMKNVSEKQLNDIEEHLSNSVDTMLKDMEENLYYKAKNELKGINRFCEPIIQDKMMTIYARAPKTETGIAFMEMQDIVKRELEKIKNEMFQAVHDSIAKELENLLLRQVLTKIREVWKISLVDCFQFSFGRLSFTEQNIAEKVSKDISAIQMETSELSKKLRIDGRTQNT